METRQRFAWLDGLRGVAILAVLLCHAWVWGGSWPLTVAGVNLLAPLDYGYLGVHLFLVLSGFCLALPYVQSGATPFRPLAVRRFALSRALRILPVYYVSLALVLLLLAGSRGPAILATPQVRSAIIAHLLLLLNLSPHWIDLLNGVYWSLALEAQLYLLFPLLLWLARRRGLPVMLLGTLALTLAYRFTSWHIAPAGDAQVEWGVLTMYALPGRLWEFALGMGAAVLVTRPASANRAPRALLATLFGVAAGTVLTVAWGRFAPLTDPAYGIGFAGLVVACASVPRLGRVAAWQPLNRLGLMSYSVYLTHAPLLALFVGLAGATWQPVRALAGLALAVAFGAAFYALIERPALVWRKQIMTRGRTARQAARPAVSATAD